MATKVVFITTTGAGTFSVPVDFGSLVSVEAIGAGGNGDGGGGGGARGGGGGGYARSTTATGLVAGGTAFYSLAAAGSGNVNAAETWFNTTVNSVPATASAGVRAGGGQAGANSGSDTINASGGGNYSGSVNVGDLTYNGGNGGIGGRANGGGGGGGGAAGPGGAGGAGGDTSLNANGGSGGGGGASLTNPGNVGLSNTSGDNGRNGGAGGGGTGGGLGNTTGSGGVGGSGTAGTGGGGGGAGGGSNVTSNGGVGATGSTSFTSTQLWNGTTLSNSVATAGSGGGGGGAAYGTTTGYVGGSSGLYGGGGGGGGDGSGTGGRGAAAQGIIVFTYTTATKTVFFTTAGTGTFTVPSDFVSLDSVEAIGGGGSASISAGSGGGGGGAYAKSTSVTGLVAGGTAYYQVGAGGNSSAGGDSWFNAASNAAPTLTSQGCLAKGGGLGSGNSGGAGGASASCIGTTVNSGGNGGGGGGAGANGGGGGGGAAGPGGVGGAGGTTSAGNPGAGGGGGASLTAAGSVGGAPVGTTSGAGGNGGGGTGGGAGVTNVQGPAGNPGTAGTGGGGSGGGTASGTANGGNGGTGSTSFTSTQLWNGTTLSNSVATAGSGGGGGGIYGTASPGIGGLYGGGNGGCSNPNTAAQGIIVFTYSYNVTTYVPPTYDVTTGFRTTDPNTNTSKDLGSRYITKNYLLDVYPNIASSTGSRVAPGLWGWGDNTKYQLGLGNLGYYSSPVQVGALVNWKQVALASDSSFAIKTDGTMWSWGWNGNGNSGILGQNVGSGTIYYSSPVQIGALTTWKSVVAGLTKCHAIKTDGTLWAWGRNDRGELGVGNTVSYYSSPVQVGALTTWKQIGINACNTNADFSLALRNDGALFAWGDNRYGELGISSTGTLYYSNPIQVGALTTWKQVAGGGSVSLGGLYSLAVKTDGTLWGWGSNNFGQLGLGFAGATAATGGYYSSPVQVGALTNWKFVTLNSQQGSFGIKTDGTLWAWGYSLAGVLGLGTSSAVYYSSPVQVGALTNWKFLSANRGISCLAIKTDGTLWAWGSGSAGVLGFGNITTYNSPVQVGPLTTWKSAITSAGTSFAIQDGYI